MRKLVIILAVFVLLFVAVLVWGVARDRDPPPDGSPEMNCNGLPKKANGDIDTDRMDEWKERCAPKKAGPAANRFTPGTLLEPATISLNGNLASTSRSLGSIDDEDKIRVIKLAKVSGGAIEVTAEIEGEDKKQQLCLCTPGDRLTDKDNNRICRDAVKSGGCPDDSETGVFAVGQGGADLTFKSLIRAEAKSTKR